MLKALLLPFKMLLILLIIAVIIIMSIEHWRSKAIFSPPRRAIFEYHKKRLQQPEQYGLIIRQHNCLQGKVPCLLIEPNPATGPAKRARTLQQQLHQKQTLPPYGQASRMIVLLHGRNGRKEDLIPVAERFVAAGYRCVLPDLPAHGDSPLNTMSFGSSHFESQLPRLIVNDIRQHFNLPNQPTSLWGLSMGGAFALSAAKESPHYWQSLIIVSSFDRLDTLLHDIAYYQINNYFNHKHQSMPFNQAILKKGIKWLVTSIDWSRYLKGKPTIQSIAPAKWAKAITIPTLIVHGEHDFFIHPSRGKAIFSAIDNPDKQWVSVPTAGHNNVLKTPMQLYALMSDWLLKH